MKSSHGRTQRPETHPSSGFGQLVADLADSIPGGTELGIRGIPSGGSATHSARRGFESKRSRRVAIPSETPHRIPAPDRQKSSSAGGETEISVRLDPVRGLGNVHSVPVTPTQRQGRRHATPDTSNGSAARVAVRSQLRAAVPDTAAVEVRRAADRLRRHGPCPRPHETPVSLAAVTSKHGATAVPKRKVAIVGLRWKRRIHHGTKAHQKTR